MSEKPAEYFNSGERINPDFKIFISTPKPASPSSNDFFTGNISLDVLSWLNI
jgi:hypothetical protein